MEQFEVCRNLDSSKASDTVTRCHVGPENVKRLIIVRVARIEHVARTLDLSRADYTLMHINTSQHVRTTLAIRNTFVIDLLQISYECCNAIEI